ncbi:MAG TPA: hypothetical protein VFQ16_15390 [Burkholderiaceae bacterium]|nr:hypothetical protein [Burkholderiaceae bacterium]
MASPLQPGVQFPRDERGHHGSTRTAQAILGAALEHADPSAAEALRTEGDWRRRYPRHLVALTRAGAQDGALAVAMARTALDEVTRRFEFVRANRTLPLAEAMRSATAIAGAGLATLERRGGGSPAPAPWGLPHGGRLLQGNEARDLIGRWRERGLCEPGHADALWRVLDHPEWFDLSDRTLALLGAASEAGPLRWLAQWRANLVLVDLPRADLWQRLAGVIDAGNAVAWAPLRPDASARMTRDPWLAAGADLLTDTPEIAAWLTDLPGAGALDVGAIAYADGERHVRVSVAMDAIAGAVVAARPGSSRMAMATPTDAFAVPEAVALDAMRQWNERDGWARAAGAPLRVLSGGRWLRPHIDALVAPRDRPGPSLGVCDALVVEQGPNYALAKRLQQWRATVAHADGERMSFNVAPSTRTQSVRKNPAFRAALDGAHRFGIEVCEPATTNALMAALWVHDLRHGPVLGPGAHPLEVLTVQAHHGGLWRMGYLPRSALPLAALLGLASPGGGAAAYAGPARALP